jgi:hypothetical protein
MTSGFSARCEQIGSFGFCLQPLPAGVLGLGDEAVHLPPRNVRGRIRLAVRAARVQVVRVVVRPLADVLRRIGHADRELAVRIAREAVGAGIRPEVVIEGAVLLHDHDHVLDLVNPDGSLGRLPLRSGRRGEREHGGKNGDRQPGDDQRPAHGRVLDAPS